MPGIPNPKFVIHERRQKVLMMLSQGLNETEIAKELNMDQSTISRDIKGITKESQGKLESIVVNMLPLEYEKCKTCMDKITKECWNIYQDKSGQWTSKNKIDALKLLKEISRTKLEVINLGPLYLRAEQIEQRVKDLVQEEEKPQVNYMNLRLPAIIKQSDEVLK